MCLKVNVYVQKCSRGTCICGVAVKSGSELFILDQCRIRGHNSTSRPLRLGLLECSAKKTMDIKEIDTSSYKVSVIK